MEHTRFTVLGLNPNDVATFIVVLILSLPVLLEWSKHWILFVWPAETILIALLVGSGSRGGVLALICGSVVSLIFCWRMGLWPRSWKTWMSIVLALLFGVGIGLAAFPKGFRLGNIDVSPEASAGRRLEVWSKVPAMLAAAPNGWGLGNSAEAYGQWFEPIGENVELKHLLSSHLTWLVEFSWPLRWLYFFLWLTAFALLIPNRSFNFSFWGVAVWTAFFIALFYNAAGKWWNWPLPAMWLAAALALRFRRGIYPQWRNWIVATIASGACVGLPFLIPRTSSIPVRVWNGGNIVLIGSGKPSVAILGPSTEVLGKFYGQEIRKGLSSLDQNAGSVVIVNRSDSAADSYLAACHLIVFSGCDETALDQWKSSFAPKSDSTLVLINSRIPFTDWMKGFGHVVYCHGDFYGDPYYREWKDLTATKSSLTVKDISHHAAFIADWWMLVGEASEK